MRETIELIDRLVSLDKKCALANFRRLLQEAEGEGEADAVSTILAIIHDVRQNGRVSWPAGLESGAE